MPEIGQLASSASHHPQELPHCIDPQDLIKREEPPAITVSDFGAGDTLDIGHEAKPIEQSTYSPALLGLDEHPRLAMMNNRQVQSFPNSPIAFDRLSAPHRVYSKSNPTTPPDFSNAWKGGIPEFSLTPPMQSTFAEPQCEAGSSYTDHSMAKAFIQQRPFMTPQHVMPQNATMQSAVKNRFHDITDEEYALAKATLPSGASYVPLEDRIRMLKAYGFPISGNLRTEDYLPKPVKASAKPTPAARRPRPQGPKNQVGKVTKPPTRVSAARTQQFSHHFAQGLQQNGTLAIDPNLFNVLGNSDEPARFTPNQ